MTDAHENYSLPPRRRARSYGRSRLQDDATAEADCQEATAKVDNLEARAAVLTDRRGSRERAGQV